VRGRQCALRAQRDISSRRGRDDQRSRRASDRPVVTCPSPYWTSIFACGIDELDPTARFQTVGFAPGRIDHTGAAFLRGTRPGRTRRRANGSVRPWASLHPYLSEDGWAAKILCVAETFLDRNEMAVELAVLNDVRATSGIASAGSVQPSVLPLGTARSASTRR